MIILKSSRASSPQPSPTIQNIPVLYGQPIPLINAPTVVGIFASNGANWLYHPFTGESGVTLGDAGSGAVYADSRLFNLFHALAGTGVWGSGGRRTLPNYAGRAMVAAGQGVGLTARSPGSQFGVESRSLAAANIPPLGGSTSAGGDHSHAYVTYTALGAWGVGGDAMLRPGWHNTANSGNHAHSVTVNAGGGTQPVEVSQPSLAFPVVFFLGSA